MEIIFSEYWQLGIWLTFCIATISVIFQYFSRKASDLEAIRMVRLMSQNKKLSQHIYLIQSKMESINNDLIKLTNENIFLKNELNNLNTRVTRLQEDILTKITK